jgi:hypothetical protein
MLKSKAKDINDAAIAMGLIDPEDCKRKVVKVPAHHTSQECRVCGYTDKANRPNQATFRCQQCGHAEHADINAARNILNRAFRPATPEGRGKTAFARSYRSWEWEVKPVRGEIPPSDGDAPSGESPMGTMRQEAAPSTVPLDGDRDSTKARDMANNLGDTHQKSKLRNSQKSNCAEKEVLGDETQKKLTQSLTPSGIDLSLPSGERRANPETLSRQSIEPNSQKRSRRQRSPKRKSEERPAQTLDGIQLQIPFE